jgi:hypothetical protein
MANATWAPIPEGRHQLDFTAKPSSPGLDLGQTGAWRSLRAWTTDEGFTPRQMLSERPLTAGSVLWRPSEPNGLKRRLTRTSGGRTVARRTAT